MLISSTIGKPNSSNFYPLLSVKHEIYDIVLFTRLFVVVKELEEKRDKALVGFNKNLLPESCAKWIKNTSSSSSAFVTLFNSDFRPKLQKELTELAETQKDALNSLKEAQKQCKEPASIILKNLNELQEYFKERQAKQQLSDPWLNELTIRHYSSKYLDLKAVHLELLLRIYTQIRHLNSELAHKLKTFTDEFFLVLERCGLGLVDEKSSDYSGGFSPKTTTHSTTTWTEVLKDYSLDYDWKLACPPLDGFLSTLFNHLKSLGVNLHLSLSSSALPRIFPENNLRFGFLQKSVSGLISRSWQVNFAILQQSTGFLHLYKVNKSSNNAEGNLLIPAVGQEYSKSSLQDLNILATQFYLQNNHQPASISTQTLSPFLSIPIAKDCKVVATDPVTFSFIVKPAGRDKVTLRAFCEEEFVDWVIFLNETTGKTKKPTDDSVNEDKVLIEDSHVQHKSESESSSPTLSYTAITPESSTTSIVPIVEIENPWN